MDDVSFTLEPVPKRLADSAIAYNIEHAARPPIAEAFTFGKVKAAKNYPPFRQIMIGGDRTVWIECPTGKDEYYWRILDP